MRKEFIKLDSPLVELELMHERALIMCADLDNDYFGLAEPDYSKDNAKIRNDIVYDFLCQMRDKIQELRNLMDEREENNNG